MKKHNMAQSLDRALDGLRFRADMREQVLQAAEHPVRRPGLPRRAAAALAVCAALVIAAAAAGPTLWKIIQADLGAQAPYAVAVNAVCEDQGLRLEAVSALADARLVRVYFTVQDLEGDRLDENTHVTFSLERTAQEEWAWCSAQTEQLSYDPESRTALFVLTVTGYEAVPEDAVLCLDVERLLGGRQQVDTQVTVRDLDALEDGISDSWLTEEVLPSTQTADGRTVLLPQPEREALIEPDAPYPVVAAGIAADGKLHIRVKDQAGAVWQELYASASCLNQWGGGSGKEWAENDTAVAVDGDIDFCLEDYGPESLSKLLHIDVGGEYSTLSAPVEGNWSLEIPLQVVASETFPISITLPASPAGETVDGNALELSPLSLTLLCDPNTIYYDAEDMTGMVKSIRFEHFAPVVTLRDGTCLPPSLTNLNSWWACWSFEQPIDPEDVTSVTLNGETIPLS